MALILLRARANIPVIVCGEAGCGKTSLIAYLAMMVEVQFLALNLHAGIDEGIIMSVVLLDEVGLAETSPFNPLKVLHSLLEPSYPATGPTVSVIGISNWRLDNSKSSRALLVQRPQFSLDDLVDTAERLLNTRLKRRDLDPVVILGSQFPDDRDDYSYSVLSRIMMCVEAGRPLILTDLEIIYGSLYDLWNQNYIVVGDKENPKYFTRVALGAYANPMLFVSPNFKYKLSTFKTEAQLSNRVKHFWLESTDHQLITSRH
ncbi:unnamed protein product [Rhizophagus irregularis]|nr:unnamed protein product [Rhizophagus irregularis]